MKKYCIILLSVAATIFSASTCEKMEPGDYHDYSGARINLLGMWTLTEVQYKTAGVIESHSCDAESIMEFASQGIGFTKNMAGEVLDSWHYKIYRAAVTIFTNAEWENNLGLGEDDNRYEKGKTYYFHVLDENTISSEEKVSTSTSVINYFTRFEPSKLLIIDIPEFEEFTPSTLIIMYDVEVGKEPLATAIKGYWAEIIYDYSIIHGMAIRIPNESDINKAVDYFKSVKGVVSVDRDRIHHLTDPVEPYLEVM